MKPLAVVTGASSGIGEIFARKLAARGYSLLLTGRRRERLEALAQELGDAEVLPGDLAADDDVERLAARLRTAENLELLVNNAGFGTLHNFWEADAAGQEAMARVHVLAVVRLTRAALPGMVERGRGAVINVASVAAFMTTPHNVMYCSTKTWISTFTEGLYLELKLAGSPVKVQSLCPGFTYSEFHDTMGVERARVPKAFWLQGDFVVDESLRGLDEGRLFVIPGWRYRVVVWFEKHMPKAFQHFVAMKYGSRNRIPKK